MNYKLLSGIEEVNRERWVNFIASHPHGTVFQSPEMYDLYRNVDSYSPLVMAMEDQQGEIRILLLAVIIRDYKGLTGKISTRTLIFGGPVIDSKVRDQDSLLKLMLDALIKQVRKRSLYIQIRNLYDYSVFDPIFRGMGFSKEDHLNLIVHTSNAKDALAGISKSKIRQAKHSFANGAEFTIAETESEVLELYHLLDKMYRNKIKKPLPPLSLFNSFLKAGKEDRLGMIFLAKYQGKIIGGMVCPHIKGKALYEWYICGLDKEFPGIHPSVMLTFGAIDYAIRNEIPAFDFMGIGSPDVPYGVRDFKTRFGGRTVNYGRYLRVNNKLIFYVAKSGFILLSLLQRLFSGAYHKEKKNYPAHH